MSNIPSETCNPDAEQTTPTEAGVPQSDMFNKVNNNRCFKYVFLIAFVSQ